MSEEWYKDIEVGSSEPASKPYKSVKPEPVYQPIMNIIQPIEPDEEDYDDDDDDESGGSSTFSLFVGVITVVTGVIGLVIVDSVFGASGMALTNTTLGTIMQNVPLLMGLAILLGAASMAFGR